MWWTESVSELALLMGLVDSPPPKAQLLGFASNPFLDKVSFSRIGFHGLAHPPPFPPWTFAPSLFSTVDFRTLHLFQNFRTLHLFQSLLSLLFSFSDHEETQPPMAVSSPLSWQLRRKSGEKLTKIEASKKLNENTQRWSLLPLLLFRPSSGLTSLRS